MSKSNSDFMCQLCGKPTQCPSTMVISGGYDSAHDMERILLHVCGDCTDRLFDSLVARGTEVKEIFKL